MSRYRRGGKNGKRQQDRPASVLHRQHSSGRLSHWYSHKPVVTVDQLHKYRRKEFSHIAADCPSPPPQQPPISLSASPSFVTEYRCRYEPPYRTAEEMSVNRRHAAVPKDELQVEGEAEFSPEYADRYKDMPRERNVACRQGSHIGPFVCADDAAPEGLAFQSEQNDRYVPHPDGRRADNLRPGTGLRMDQAPMEGETEQTANYRKYPTTPHPDAGPDRNEATQSALKEFATGLPARRPHDESMKEMILTRDSGMLLRPVRSFAVIGGPQIERAGGSHVKRPAFRLQVVDCSGVTNDGSSSDGDGNGDGRTTDAFVVLTKCSDRFRSPPSSAVTVERKRSPGTSPQPSHHHHLHPHTVVLGVRGGGGGGGSGGSGNRWVKRRQRKMGTVRFFDDLRDRSPATVAGKTIQ